MDHVEARLAVIAEAIARDAPFRLPGGLESDYEAASVKRRVDQLRAYLFVTGVANLSCVGFDAEFGIWHFGLIVRLCVVGPLFLIGIMVLSTRRAAWLQGLAFAVPILATVCESVVIGSMIGGIGADRYIGAAGVVAFTVNLASFLRLKHAVILGAVNAIAIISLTLALNAPARWPHFVDLLVFATFMTLVTLRTMWRLERWHRRAFLLGERDRLQTEVLVRTNRALERQSRTDALTEVANRRAFDETLAKSIACHKPIGLLMIDIDYFKAFNDAAGHEAGDRCLREVAQVIAREAEGQGYVARMGGEEFSIILPTADREAAFGLGERIRLAVAGRGLDHPGLTSGGCVTVSVGAASIPQDRCLIDGAVLLKEADDALYVSKIGGRNMTSHADALSLVRRDATAGPDSHSSLDRPYSAPISSAA